MFFHHPKRSKSKKTKNVFSWNNSRTQRALNFEHKKLDRLLQSWNLRIEFYSDFLYLSFWIITVLCLDNNWHFSYQNAMFKNLIFKKTDSDTNNFRTKTIFGHLNRHLDWHQSFSEILKLFFSKISGHFLFSYIILFSNK